MFNRNSKLYKMRVGYTVFLGLIIFFLFVVLVGTKGNYLRNTYELKILLKDTQGLREGASVSLAGLKVGEIDKIEFISIDEDNLVLLRLSIREEYSNHITDKSFARIETSGLLGEKLINISMGNTFEPNLKNGDILPVKESLSLDKLTDKIEPIANNVNAVVSNLKIITDSISRGKGSIGELVINSTFAVRFNSMLTNLDEFTAKLNQPNNTIGKLVNTTEFYDNINSLAGNIKMLTDSLNSGKGTLGKLLVDDSFYNELNDLTDNLNQLVLKTDNNNTIIGGALNDTGTYAKITMLIEELNKLIVDVKENPDRYINISVF
ncbi:MAG: MlaD family protein [Melioribacteraceae bacterium]|nr:MAG: MlaD family protein [Melioribacteraceae bacterium]